MTTTTPSQRLQRYLLAVLLLIVGLNALAGGYYGSLGGAPNVPLEWLQGSPFSSYFIPSLILAIFVGGSSLYAAVAVLTKSARARLAVRAAAFILFVWIVVQVSIIGYVSWLQPAMVVTAVAELLLSRSQSGPAPTDLQPTGT